MTDYKHKYVFRLVLVAICLLPPLFHGLPWYVALAALAAIMLVYQRIDKGVTALYTISRYLRNQSVKVAEREAAHSHR